MITNRPTSVYYRVVLTLQALLIAWVSLLIASNHYGRVMLVSGIALAFMSIETYVVDQIRKAALAQ